MSPRSAGMAAITAASAARSAASHATTLTVSAPSSRSAVTSSEAPGASMPRRDVSRRCRTPCTPTRCRHSGSPELAQTSGHKHSRGAPKPQRRGALRIASPHSNQARREPAFIAPRKLRLAIQCQCRRRQHLPRDCVACVEVHQPKLAVGMLAARTAHEAPQRRMRKIRHPVVGTRADRRARHEHHRRSRQTRLGQQLLKRPQRLSRRTLSRSR